MNDATTRPRASAPVHSPDWSPAEPVADTMLREFADILGAIGAFADLIRTDIEDRPRATDNLTHLQHAWQRAHSLVGRLQHLDHPGRLRKRPINLTQLIRAEADFFRLLVPHPHSLELQLQEDSPTILADPTQLHDLILNLLARAVFALGSNPGTIQLNSQTCDISEAEAALLPGLPPGRCILLRLTDTGHSLDTELIQQAMDGSNATPSAIPNPGATCLSIARTLTAAHSGILLVQSGPNDGTAVHVYLPAHATRPDRIVPDGMPLGHGEHVLFVDDDPAQCRAATQILQRLGYTPAVYLDPDAALAAFRTDTHSFDVALLDLNMPNITGIDLATSLLELRPKLPIYLVTGVQGDWTPDMARNLGIRAVLMKPLSPVTWCLTLHEALSEKPSPT